MSVQACRYAFGRFVPIFFSLKVRISVWTVRALTLLCLLVLCDGLVVGIVGSVGWEVRNRVAGRGASQWPFSDKGQRYSVPIELCLPKQAVGSIWPPGCSLQALVLEVFAAHLQARSVLVFILKARGLSLGGESCFPGITQRMTAMQRTAPKGPLVAKGSCLGARERAGVEKKQGCSRDSEGVICF